MQKSGRADRLPAVHGDGVNRAVIQAVIQRVNLGCLAGKKKRTPIRRPRWGVFLFIRNHSRSCILTSGSPASDVKRLTIAAIAADEPTTAQLTSDSNAEVASTPQAVCAAVLIARTVAALSQIVQFVFM